MSGLIGRNAQGYLGKLAVKGLGKGLNLSHKAPLFAQQKVWLSLLNKMLAEPLQEGGLDCLQQSWLQVQVVDIGVSWYFTLTAGKLAMQVEQPFDFLQYKHCIISGELMDLIRLVNRQQDPDTLFFQRRLLLTGDTELGLEIRNVLDAIDVDDLPEKAKILMHWSAQLTASH
ncbi:MAG: SCP2 sterol-binding domain-containing protein [Gammaproteobacteria bacterium]|nr:SCP2 sterol-binding domain-containing protein [Gammaproteobacteria bacterium]